MSPLCVCVIDVEVVFELPDGSWSTKAEFSPNDIHKQVFYSSLTVRQITVLLNV